MWFVTSRGIKWHYIFDSNLPKTHKINKYSIKHSYKSGLLNWELNVIAFILQKILNATLLINYLCDLIWISQTIVSKGPIDDTDDTLSLVYLKIYPLSKLMLNYFNNSSPPGQNDRHFGDGVLKCICLNEKVYILIQISLKFNPKGPIDNDSALVKWWLGAE